MPVRGKVCLMHEHASREVWVLSSSGPPNCSGRPRLRAGHAAAPLARAHLLDDRADGGAVVLAQAAAVARIVAAGRPAASVVHLARLCQAALPRAHVPRHPHAQREHHGQRGRCGHHRGRDQFAYLAACARARGPRFPYQRCCRQPKPYISTAGITNPNPIAALPPVQPCVLASRSPTALALCGGVALGWCGGVGEARRQARSAAVNRRPTLACAMRAAHRRRPPPWRWRRRRCRRRPTRAGSP